MRGRNVGSAGSGSGNVKGSTPNVLNEKGAKDFLSEKKFDAEVKKFMLWRNCLAQLSADKNALVLERSAGVVDQEVVIKDIISVRMELKRIHVISRQKEVVFRLLNDEENTEFFIALKALVGEIHDAALLSTRIVVAEQLFRDFDGDGDGQLDLAEMKLLLTKLKTEVTSAQVQALVRVSGRSNCSTVNKTEFINLFAHIFRRGGMLTSIFHVYAGNDEILSLEELRGFLISEQGLSEEDAVGAAKTILDNFAAPETPNSLSLDQFLDYLFSGYNHVVDPSHDSMSMDMMQPLCSYFISSSHNTYLEGNQLTGSASAESYSKSLKAGARCVEFDMWEDEEGEPIITHGHTLTGEIKFCDVLSIFDEETVFGHSPYPLILSFEDHLSRASRHRMVEIMRSNTSFWSMLYKPDPSLPLEQRLKLSPEDLKRRILIKMKVKQETPQELADLIFMLGKKHKGTWAEVFELPVGSCVSHDESRMQQFVDEGEGEKVVKFNLNHFTRVYPSGKRVDSSNHDPTVAWLHGCQLVALNNQTIDEAWFLNKALFMANGGCGYLLKPPRLLGLAPLDTQTVVEVRILYGHSISPPDVEPHVSVKCSFCRGTSKYKAIKSTANGVTIGFQHQSERTPPPFAFEVFCKELATLTFKVKVQQKLSKLTLGCAVFPVNYMRRGYRAVPFYDQQSGEQLPNYIQLLCHFQVKDA